MAFDGLGRVVFVLILGVFIAVRVKDLQFTLWNDEVFSVMMGRLGWPELLADTAYDIVHPPGFYALLKVWMAIGGESLAWLRALPVATAVITVIPFLGLCRELRLSPSEVNLSFFLIATNWFLSWHASDVRMYMLLLFFATTSLWLFLRVLQSDTNEWLTPSFLCLVNIALVYTHYYGWLVIGAEVCYAALAGIRGFIRPAMIVRLVVVTLVVILSFLPWAAAVLHSIRAVGSLQRNLGFIERPDLKDVLWFYVKLNGIFMSDWRTVSWTAVVGLLLFGFPIVLWARDVIARTRREHDSDGRMFWLLVFGAFVPVGIAFLVSHELPVSVFGDRYLIISSIPYLLLATHAASRLTPRWLGVTTVTLMVIWVSLAGLQGMTRQRFSWGHVVQEMRMAESPQTTGRRVLAIATFAQMPVEYYLNQADDERFALEMIGNSEGLERAVGIGNPANSSLWVAYGDTGRRAGELPETILVNKGYSLGERFESGSPGRKVVIFRACWQACSTGVR